MRKLTLSLLLMVLSLQAGVHAQTPSSVILNQTAADYDTWLKQEDLGIQQQYGLPITQLPQVSLIKAKQDAARAQLMLGRLASIKTAELTHDEWLNREALAWYLKSVVDGQRFYWLNSSATPYNGPIASVNEALGLMRFENKADADRYLDLITQYARLVRQVRAKLDGQAQRKMN
jgi:uncharacterized protein (DUF885 family)